MIETDVETPDATLEKPPIGTRTNKSTAAKPALTNAEPLPKPASPRKLKNTFRFWQAILVLLLVAGAGAIAWLVLQRAEPDKDASPASSATALDDSTANPNNEAAAIGALISNPATTGTGAISAQTTTASPNDNNSSAAVANIAEVAITDLQSTQASEAQTTNPATSENNNAGNDESDSTIAGNLAQLGWGTVGFAAPEKMTLGKLEEVTLKISRSMPMDALKDVLQNQLNDSTDLVIMQSDVRLSNRMQAILTGASFSITQITPDIQAVSPEHSTTWSWQIEANKTGEQKIFLTLVALIDVEGKDTAHAVETFRKEVRVNVTAGYQLRAFVADNWQWLWAVIVAPAGLAFWRYVKSPNRGPG